ncbi:MAG: (2Fe-2S)-binding protein [Actinobacteria bacterium]|nr:(2Fe-2S)-binding protein [Actinomycetota bacterium]
MPRVSFIDADGSETTATAASGQSLMEAAIANGIDGIVAECGGNMMCATCHVYVDEPWADRLPPRSPVEDEMLGETVCPRRAGSRLSCQIRVDEDLDGLVVELPEAQV